MHTALGIYLDLQMRVYNLEFAGILCVLSRLQTFEVSYRTNIVTVFLSTFIVANFFCFLILFFFFCYFVI